MITQSEEPQEYIPVPSQLETELACGAADIPGSTEEVVTDTPDSSHNLPGHVIAAAQQTALKPTHASRKQLAISVMAVLALVAALTTIAIFKPQQQVVSGYRAPQNNNRKNRAKNL